MDFRSDNSQQLQKDSEVKIASPRRSLSPVLSIGKKTKKPLPFNNKFQKRRSKINLCTRYSNSPVKSENYTNEVGSGDNERLKNPLCKKPDTRADTGDTLEQRIKKIQDIENKRKAFYDSLCNISINTTDSDKFCFKKPLSPVRTSQKFKSFRNKLHKPEEASSSKYYDLPPHPTNTFQGFQTGSGKKIVVSENAIKRRVDLFTDIFKDETKCSDSEPVVRFTPKIHEGFQCASGKAVTVSKTALVRASNLFADQNFDDLETDTCNSTAVDCDKKQSINREQKQESNKTAVSSEIHTTTKALLTSNVPQKSFEFSQDDVTDTQINFAMDSIESAIDIDFKNPHTDCKYHTDENEKTLQQEILELQELLEEELPDFTRSFITDTITDSNTTVKSLQMKCINDANQQCKNMLNVINLVHKNIESNSDEEITSEEFEGFDNCDIVLSCSKLITCKNLVRELNSKLDNVYHYGFTKNDKSFSASCVKNGLNNVQNLKKEILKCETKMSRRYNTRLASKQSSAENDLITLFKNKKRTQNKMVLPPKKRMKYTGSTSEEIENESNSSTSDMSSNDRESIDKQKYTEVWCNSFFDTGHSNSDANSENAAHHSIQSVSIDSEDNHVNLSTEDSKTLCAMSKFSFKSASGKSIALSEDSLQKAQKLFEDIKNENIDNNQFQSSTRASAKHIKVNQITGAVLGFKSASDKTITISKDAISKAQKIFDSIDREVNLAEVEDSSNAQCRNIAEESICDIKKSSTKAQEIINQIKNSVTEPKQNVNLGFKNAFGKEIAVSKQSLMKAQNMFKETEQVQSTNLDTTTESPIRPENRLSESSSLKIQDSPCHSSNLGSKSAKKRLGISSYRQINIPNSKLEKAKQLFSDIDEFPHAAAAKPISTSTPIKSFTSKPTVKPESPSAANISAVLHNQSETMKNVPTPVKHSKIPENSNSPVLIQKETKGDLNSWLKNLEDECELLECQLKVLGKRKEALQEQKVKLEIKTGSNEGQREGILYTKKKTSARITLRNFVGNLKPGEINITDINESILNTTAQNAEYVHFNCNSTGKCDIIRTLDNACVVPNIANLVGISEIETAFNAAPGVQPNLIPYGWIRNHYKWIVWKLASMERSFPLHCKDVLNIENVMQQLKYRYDREIDKAERSAIKRILEKDDSAQKRIVLVVSDIFQVPSDMYELELCDGWYSVRTVIDLPLCDQIRKRRIRIGTKLVIHGAELINCEGCHPLEAPESLRMKIQYNSTRRIVWYAKLGYQMYPGPLLVPLKTIHPKGGVIGHLRVHVARVYPLRFMEKQGETVTWRNERAEQKRARQWENDKFSRIEEIRDNIEKEYEKQLNKEKQSKSSCNIKKKDIPNITCSKTLHELLTDSNDPDSVMELLSPSQRSSVLEFSRKTSEERQQMLSKKVLDAVTNAKLIKRDVIPILKIVVVDALNCGEKGTVFNIWRPSAEILGMIKEGVTLSVYNAVPKNDGTLGSTSKTKFELESSRTSHFKKVGRQILPIALTIETFFSPFLNEFDTVGVVAKVRIDLNSQDLWLADFHERLLLVKLNDGPSRCLLFDGLEPGQVIVASNLILHESQNTFGLAVANHYTVITRYPQNKALQEGLKIFKKELPQNIDIFVANCNEKIDVCVTKLDFIHSLSNRSYSQTPLAQTTSLSITDILNDTSADETTLNSQLTAVDVAMSMIDIDTDKLCKE